MSFSHRPGHRPGHAPSPASSAGSYHHPQQQQQHNMGRASSVHSVASSAQSHSQGGYAPSSQYSQQTSHSPAGGHPQSSLHQGSAMLSPPSNTRNRPPPPGADPTIWSWFTIVDADGSGHISAQELQRALKNGDHSSFDQETIKMLLGMFDEDRDGAIGFKEFCDIFKYVEQWQAIFRRFDADRSGTIDASELSRALSEFQYNLSPKLIDLLCRKYSAVPASTNRPVGITFDRFVRCCVSIKTLTDAFMEVDADRDGWATISYDRFLEMVLSAP